MPVGPRVVFTRFATSRSPKLVPWERHSSRLTGVDAGALSRVGPRDDTGAVIWHLVSGNNRMLARSAQIFGSIPEAVLGAESAIAAVVHLVVALVDEDGGGERGWYAKLAEVPILTCARWYRSERDRRNSIDSAITSLESATLRPGSSLMSPARTGSA